MQAAVTLARTSPVPARAMSPPARPRAPGAALAFRSPSCCLSRPAVGLCAQELSSASSPSPVAAPIALSATVCTGQGSSDGRATRSRQIMPRLSATTLPPAARRAHVGGHGVRLRSVAVGSAPDCHWLEAFGTQGKLKISSGASSAAGISQTQLRSCKHTVTAVTATTPHRLLASHKARQAGGLLMVEIWFGHVLAYNDLPKGTPGCPSPTHWQSRRPGCRLELNLNACFSHTRMQNQARLIHPYQTPPPVKPEVATRQTLPLSIFELTNSSAGMESAGSEEVALTRRHSTTCRLLFRASPARQRQSCDATRPSLRTNSILRLNPVHGPPLAQAEQLVVPRVQPHAQAAGQGRCLAWVCQGVAGQEQLRVGAGCSR